MGFLSMDMVSIAPLSWVGIFVAVLSGGIVGVERQIFGKPAGIRTSALICLGSYLFIVISRAVLGNGDGDAVRVLGQIVTGIGFLGGGVIISREGVVQGMTSAAVIWVLAGMGSLIGFGYYFQGFLLSLIVLTILLGVDRMETVFKKVLRRGVHKQGSHKTEGH